MKTRPLSLTRLSTLLSSLAMLPAASRAATLVDVSATALPLGPVTSWTNSGTLGGSFAATGSTQVINVGGYRTVRLNGGGDYFTGPEAGPTITGVNKPVTVEAWVHNPNIPGEETVVAWGRRGGPVATNASYNYGSDSRWGAVGHWGGEDIGWIDQDITVGAPAANAWHYLVWTYDGVTQRLYSDAVPMHFENKSLNVWATSTTGARLPIRIGAQNNDNGSVSQFNDGIHILRIRIKDTAMSEAEIVSKYTAEKAALDANVTPSINSFSVGILKFVPGESVILNWSLGNATSASINGEPVSPTTGSITYTPSASTTYTLTATNANGSVSQSLLAVLYQRPPTSHRWSFNEGSGTVVTDSAAGPSGNGALLGTEATVAAGSGTWERTSSQVLLGGGSSESSAYIDLPNDLLSGLNAVTVEGWMTLNSSQNWSRIFDFGTSSAGEVFAPGGSFQGSSYLILTGQVGGDQGVKRLEVRNSFTLDVSDPVVQGEEFHFAVVFDDRDDVGAPGTNRVRYYKNGTLLGSTTSPQPLGFITNNNNWLGRSNWAGDANTDGAYNEVRVWAGALRPEDISLSYINGPDAPTLPPTTPPVVSTFSANTRSFFPSEGVTLTWGIAGSVVSSSIDQGVGALTPAAGGTLLVYPTATTTYTISSTNTYGTSTRSVTVNPATLAHRWSFNEAPGSTAAMDSVGSAHGTVLGTPGSPATGGNGLWSRNGREVCLGGGISQTAAYIDLPNGILSSKTDVTIEGWVTINGNQAWSRIFDFGNTSAGELFAPGGDGGGVSNFLLSAQFGADTNIKRLQINPGTSLDSNDPVVFGQKFHFAVVYDSVGNAGSPQMRYYSGGVYKGAVGTATRLNQIQDVNNWLGRSNWTGDANLDGCYDELRIWSTPLSGENIEEISNTPVDSLPYAPPAAGPMNLASTSWTHGTPGTRSSATVTWNSTAGRAYIVQISSDLITWVPAVDAATGDTLIITASAATTTASSAIPLGVRTFVRVADLSP